MKRIILIALIAFTGHSSNAQDVHFSQFWNNGIQYNPAMTGVIPANLRVAAFYRNQWSSVSSTPYNSYGLNADGRIDTQGTASIGIGLNFFRDVAGDTKLGTTHAQLALSTIIAMGDNSKLSIGLNGGIIQHGFDPTAAQWNSQYHNGSYDATMSSGEAWNGNAGLKGDVSAGLVYTYSTSRGALTANDNFNLKVGFAFNHIATPKYEWTPYTTDALYRNIVGHIECLIGLPNSKVSLKPAVIAQFQGPSKEILFGNQFKFKLQEASQVTGFVKGTYLSIGTFMRWGDAFIPSVTLEFDRYSIGASYDVNISQLRTASNGAGGFEISLKFRTPNPYLWSGSQTRSRFR